MKYVVSLVLGLLVVSCASEGDGPGCVQTEQAACVLSSGAMGFQVCNGGVFGACQPTTGSVGGGGDGAAALRAQLENRRFEWESFETSSNGSTQAFSELVLCQSGVFALTQRDNSFFPGSGSVQGEDSHAGRWSVTAAAGGGLIALEVTQSTAESVTSPIELGVAIEGDQVTFDDNYDLANTGPATVSDATAVCASATEPGPAPSGGSCQGVPAPEDACGECLAASCCTELQACVAGTPCGALLACSQLCPELDDACVLSECPAGVEDGVPAANALIECNQSACAASCG